MIDVDTVVIGSGAGGLTTALCLAQAGQRVLVLEQHYVPGGWCHSFKLDKYRFNPGVHYMGELGPGGRMRECYEGLGVAKDLRFLELNPDGYEHLQIAGERFDFPKGRQALTERLKSRFPHEAAGIDTYLDACDKLNDELRNVLEFRGLKDLVALPFRMPTVAKLGNVSVDSFVRRNIRDPMLRAILCVQSGDHGVLPSMAPFPLHASIGAHYFDGAYYPRGGGSTIAQAFVRALKRCGGRLQLRTEVQRILVEGKRAIGVRCADGTEVRANRVVSNADPHVTFIKLVGEQHLGWWLRKRLARVRYSVSAVSLFAALDMDLEAMGFDSGNYWYSDSTHMAGVTELGFDPKALTREDIPSLFLTVTTLKDRSKFDGKHHTIEAFIFVPYGPFEKWANSTCGERPAQYQACKERLKARMIKAAAKIIPGLEKHLVFAELGTPLTNEFYVAGTAGNIYGTEKSIRQMGPWGFGVTTPIRDLYMCGASTIGHGIFGATLSGMVAARRILDCEIDDLLTDHGQRIETFPCDDVSAWPESWKGRARPRDQRRLMPVSAPAEL